MEDYPDTARASTQIESSQLIKTNQAPDASTTQSKQSATSTAGHAIKINGHYSHVTKRPTYGELYDSMEIEPHGQHLVYYITDVMYRGETSRLRLDPAHAASAEVTHAVLRERLRVEPNRNTSMRVWNKRDKKLIRVPAHDSIYLMGKKIYLNDDGLKPPAPPQVKSPPPATAATTQPSAVAVDTKSSAAPDVIINLASVVGPTALISTASNCETCAMSYKVVAGSGRVSHKSTSTALIYEDDAWMIVLNTDHAGHWIGRCTLYTKKHYEAQVGNCISKSYIESFPRALELIKYLEKVTSKLWNSAFCTWITSTGTPRLRDDLSRSTAGKLSVHGAIDVIPRYANVAHAANRIWYDEQYNKPLNLEGVSRYPFSQLQIREIKRLMSKELVTVLRQHNEAVPDVTIHNSEIESPYAPKTKVQTIAVSPARASAVVASSSLGRWPAPMLIPPPPTAPPQSILAVQPPPPPAAKLQASSAATTAVSSSAIAAAAAAAAYPQPKTDGNVISIVHSGATQQQPDFL